MRKLCKNVPPLARAAHSIAVAGTRSCSPFSGPSSVWMVALPGRKSSEPPCGTVYIYTRKGEAAETLYYGDDALSTKPIMHDQGTA